MEKADRLLKRLRLLDAVELREQWFIHFNSEAGNSMSSKLLRLAVGYKVQELEYEASERCKSIRKRAAEYQKGAEHYGHGYAQRLRPGTRLLREYKGKVHEVLVVDNGQFVYEGQVCKSLSEVGRKITGSSKGSVFFGLRGRKWGVLDG